jgi:hypothetical protein
MADTVQVSVKGDLALTVQVRAAGNKGSLYLQYRRVPKMSEWPIQYKRPSGASSHTAGERAGDSDG